MTQPAAATLATSADRPSAVVNIAETAATNGILGALGIGTGIIAARWLGPEGRGELAAIQMWPTAIAAMAMLGLPDALVYFAAKNRSESRRYLVTAGLIAFLVTPLFAVAAYYLLPRLLPTQSERVVQGARAYLIMIPVFVFLALPHQFLRGLQLYRLWNVIRIVPALLWLAALCGGLWMKVNDPVSLAAAFVVLLACVAPAVAWTVWKRSAGPAAPTRATAASLMKFGLPSALATLPQFFNLRLDQLMVAAVVPARDLGVYTIAVAWSACIPMISSALAVIVSTQIASGTSDTERRRRFTDGVRRGAWLIALPVALLIAATPVGVTTVFGRAFQAAIIPALILVIASGVNAFNGVIEELLRGYGRPSATLWAETIAVGVGLPSLLILLPRAGLTGASLASLLGYLAATVILLVDSHRSAGLNILTVLDPRTIRWTNLSFVDTVRLRLSR
jgi:O-antigen/teichoic acid export membrane protein